MSPEIDPATRNRTGSDTEYLQLESSKPEIISMDVESVDCLQYLQVRHKGDEDIYASSENIKGWILGTIVVLVCFAHLAEGL